MGMGVKKAPKTVADFFAGIGLVTLGLNRAGWKTVYALDYDPLKEFQYTSNFGKRHFHTKDIAYEQGKNVPNVTLAHASFPCTDLSLAGSRKGIYEGESQAFWEFARILQEMKRKHGDDNPNYVLIENVEGLLTSNDGNDLRELLQQLNKLGYFVDLLRINASHFVAQSRVRIFIIGVHESLVSAANSTDLMSEFNLRSTDARPAKIVSFINKQPDIKWYFHRLPQLPVRQQVLSDIIDESEKWWPEERTAYLYSQLHDRQKVILQYQKDSGVYRYYAGFRRMRERDGRRQPTVELRNDDIAGCLRTPKGGSARQIVVRAGKGRIDARLFNAREAARLMGADDFVISPELTLNQALFGFGDAVCVPVLQWLGDNYFNPLLDVRNTELVEETAMLEVFRQAPVLNLQD